MQDTIEKKYTFKDFASDQEVRWCPGCDDYVILRSMQKALPEMGVNKEDVVFISGIGCSSRFPYYIDSYGMHSIHGRAAAISSGVKLANPDLSVWMITGDGDRPKNQIISLWKYPAAFSSRRTRTWGTGAVFCKIRRK